MPANSHAPSRPGCVDPALSLSILGATIPLLIVYSCDGNRIPLPPCITPVTPPRLAHSFALTNRHSPAALPATPSPYMSPTSPLTNSQAPVPGPIGYARSGGMPVWTQPGKRSWMTALAVHSPRRPSRPANRPWPDALTPPKGSDWLR